MATSWFKYDGTGSVSDPTNYFQITTVNCPNPNNKLCAINADIQFIGGDPRPTITPALQVEITNALNTKVESANVSLEP